MKVGRVPSLEGFLLELWRHLADLRWLGGLTSVVAHFSRAALSSAWWEVLLSVIWNWKERPCCISIVDLLLVHNNVKIVAKCLTVSLEEALDLVTHTNWTDLAKVAFKNFLNLEVVTCNDLKPQVILIQLYSQKNLLVRWLELFLHADGLNLYFSVVLCSSCAALGHTVCWFSYRGLEYGLSNLRFCSGTKTTSMTFWVCF